MTQPALKASDVRPNSPAGVERDEIRQLLQLLFTSLDQEMRFAVHDRIQPIITPAEPGETDNNFEFRILIAPREAPFAKSDPMHEAVRFKMPEFICNSTPEREQSQQRGKYQPRGQAVSRETAPLNQGFPARKNRQSGGSHHQVAASRRLYAEIHAGPRRFIQCPPWWWIPSFSVKHAIAQPHRYWDLQKGRGNQTIVQQRFTGLAIA